MSSEITNHAAVYGDFAGLQKLKASAHANDPNALRQVAQQFESLFARMMIKSMREAIGTDPIFGSDQAQTYQSMFDDQLSMDLTKGKGLGLTDMLMRQLQRRRRRRGRRCCPGEGCHRTRLPQRPAPARPRRRRARNVRSS